MRYVTGDTSLAEGVDQTVAPEKPIKDKEKQALLPFKVNIARYYISFNDFKILSTVFLCVCLMITNL